jgi:hypothetical protein
MVPARFDGAETHGWIGSGVPAKSNQQLMLLIRRDYGQWPLRCFEDHMLASIKYMAAILGMSLLIMLGAAVTYVFDANDHIDQCSDDTSGLYIFHDKLRGIICGFE